jgi:ParB/RepB/Spo0J family partition protein
LVAVAAGARRRMTMSTQTQTQKTQTQSYQLVPIAKIDPNPKNPRKTFDPKKDAELAESVRVRGITIPVLVRPINGRFELVYGERRCRAAQVAKLSEIPAYVRELSDAEALEEAVIENCNREDISPLEEADAYLSLRKDGNLVDDISAKVGKSTSYVYGRLKLALIAGDVREALVKGWITAGAAILLARIEHTGQQVKALKEALKYRGTREIGTLDVRRFVRDYSRDLREAPFDANDAELVLGAGACTTCPKRSGNQPDLFSKLDEHGDEPETCTDVACYKIKIEAAWERTQAKALAKGLTILDAKGVLESGGATAAYVKADATHPDCYLIGKHAVNKTWKQLVGKTVKPSIVRDPNTGAAVEVYEKKVASKALPPEFKKSASKSTSEPNYSEINAEADKRFASEVAEAATKATDADVLRSLALNALDSYLAVDIIESMGWDGSTKTKSKARIEAATPAEIRTLVIIANTTEGFGLDFEILGVDRAEIRKQVEKDLRAAMKAAAKEKEAAEKVKPASKSSKASKKAVRS